MKIERMKCDNCREDCTEEYLTIYRTVRGNVIGRGDYCPSCYEIMHNALKGVKNETDD